MDERPAVVIWRVTVVFGAMLLVISGVMSIVRQKPSEAYWIAYLDNPIDTKLTIMAADGSGKRAILKTSLDQYWHAWSPDGKWIALAGYSYPNNPIFLIRPFSANPNPTPITDFGGNYQTWSPDSQSIAYVRYGRQADVFIASIDGSASLQVTDTPAVERDLSWSPDGQWIYYIVDVVSDPNLQRTSIDGRTSQRLTPLNFSPSTPVWSLDGEWIAFDGFSLETGYDLYMMRPDGSDLHAVATDLSEAITPRSDGSNYRWSPTDDWLVFSTGFTGGFNFIRPDGTGLHNVSTNYSYYFTAEWSPNGEWIIFAAVEHDIFNIFRMRPDGSGLQNLTNNRLNTTGSVLPAVSPLFDQPFSGGRLLGLGSGLLVVGIFGMWMKGGRP